MISLKNQQFKSVYENGKAFGNRLLVMYVLKNDEDYNRIGISVSKKVGNSVVRHRIKRLIKESLRLGGNLFNNGLDIVVIAKREAYGKDFWKIDSAVKHLAEKHKILVNQSGEG
ncbi:MAG: ribonuclease P protein component [Lachnospiraceae bacterium]|nr:ribonuclease P protein component [Lachnospiraceae bacterium]MBR6274903.1 ribonuclease P protein component [Lachnospiraceae bacterium]